MAQVWCPSYVRDPRGQDMCQYVRLRLAQQQDDWQCGRCHVEVSQDVPVAAYVSYYANNQVVLVTLLYCDACQLQIRPPPEFQQPPPVVDDEEEADAEEEAAVQEESDDGEDLPPPAKYRAL